MKNFGGHQFKNLSLIILQCLELCFPTAWIVSVYKKKKKVSKAVKKDPLEFDIDSLRVVPKDSVSSWRQNIDCLLF